MPTKITKIKVEFSNPNNDKDRVTKILQIKGKVTYPAINRGFDKLHNQMKKTRHFVLYNYDRIVTDQVEIGYCPKCKKEYKYNTIYGNFDDVYKCPKGHKMYTTHINCYKCDGKMWQVSQRQVHSECIVMTYKCVKCGQTEEDVMD